MSGLRPPIAPPNYSAPLIHMAGMQGSGPNAKIPKLPNGQIDHLGLAKAVAPQTQPPPLFQNGSWGVQPPPGLK